ncbi:hypothetical protein [Actinopolymorpha pittospori]|uniref:Uncharacterized protein n=1 Tax=Actinopolymorpha pittospori TaxID=648752 RepID=A0A927N5Q1_9ACTN|nr:hypothetical protein [Actinopolymorpha pittospori]MBE1612157.1 hypothetical protein [Actinopolymorpha pittospori]
MIDEVYTATVHELVENFRSGLIAMLPIADRAMLNSRDVNPHDDWEQLAESIFDVFVRGSVRLDRVSLANRDQFPLPRYDFDLDSYSALSWIGCGSGPSSDLAFVRLLSHAEPFDTVQRVEVDPVTLEAGQRRTFPWASVSFVLVRRSPVGTAVAQHIDAIA